MRLNTINISRYFFLSSPSRIVNDLESVLREYPKLSQVICLIAHFVFASMPGILAQGMLLSKRIKLYDTLNKVLNNRVISTIFMVSLIFFITQNLYFLTLDLSTKIHLRIKGYIQSRQRQKLVKILQAWLPPANQIQSDQVKARDIIIKAFDDRAVSLSLVGLGLNSLPPIFDFFKDLRVLNLSFNALTDVPSEISCLTKLEELHLESNRIENISEAICSLLKLKLLNLSGNRITHIPPKIDQLQKLMYLGLALNQITLIPLEMFQLQELLYLTLAGNQIAYLPPEIGRLQKLKTLRLCHNQLRFIPQEISDLQELRQLRISYNPSLNELPIAMGQLAHLEELLIDGTQIPVHFVPQILQACRSARDRIARQLFIERARLWITMSGNQDGELAETWQNAFNDEKKPILIDWLLRLEKAADFANNQKNLASTVCQIIQAIIDHPSFSETFWDQVRANNENCEDRAAMALNELFTSYVLHTVAANRSLEDQLQIIERTAKTLALRRQLANLIDQRQKSGYTVIEESAEIFLYYESQLQKDLHLLTAIEDMKYSIIGERSWIDRKQLVKQVNDSYLNDLIRIPAFLEIIEKDSEFQNDWSAKADSYIDRLTKEEEKKPSNCSEYDQAYLDWACKLGEIKEQREQEKNMLMKQWFLSHQT